MRFGLRKGKRAPTASRSTKRPEGAPATIDIPGSGFLSIQGEGFYVTDGPARFLSFDDYGPLACYTYMVNARLDGEPYRVYLRVPWQNLPAAVEGRYDWGRHIIDAEWLGGDMLLPQESFNAKGSRSVISAGDQATRVLAGRLAEFYTLVEPYEFRDHYGYDINSVAYDMMGNLRTADDVMAAREWLEEVYVPDAGADNLRNVLIDELDRFAATRSSNRRGSFSRRHRNVRKF